MVKKVILSGIVLFELALNTGWSQNKLSAIENFKEPQATGLKPEMQNLTQMTRRN